MLDIKIHDYHYPLTADKIALYPLAERDQSKLLVYKRGEIIHSTFRGIESFLPTNSALFFNNTKVLPARLHFQKISGATIELFLLQPVTPSSDVQLAMQSRNCCSWKCAIGNLKRWNESLNLIKKNNGLEIQAKLVNFQEKIVEFSWTPGELTFAEVIQTAGEIPLPPYLHRDATEEDKIRYQTVYSYAEGAVAAPTAGLHFTEAILHRLKQKKIPLNFLTLHVGAGTFLPVKVSSVFDHDMHTEQIQIEKKTIEALLNSDSFPVAVGTTSIRTLESVYWYGVKLALDETAPCIIDKLDPYSLLGSISVEQSLACILSKMEKEKKEILAGQTSILIAPGYSFKICKGLITNFHQPASTLMLLVAAFVGADWKTIYQSALDNNYRFLSYGDSSLLLP